jgi:drug/metabolite transporter superfamily protein YnfA
MKQNAFWEQFSIGCYQLWIWLKYEAGAHPFLAVGVVVVVIFAWAMYKTEVRSR